MGTLSSLFKDIAVAVEENEEFVAASFGPQALLELVAGLQQARRPCPVPIPLSGSCEGAPAQVHHPFPLPPFSLSACPYTSSLSCSSKSAGSCMPHALPSKKGVKHLITLCT